MCFVRTSSVRILLVCVLPSMPCARWNYSDIVRDFLELYSKKCLEPTCSLSRLSWINIYYFWMTFLFCVNVRRFILMIHRVHATLSYVSQRSDKWPWLTWPWPTWPLHMRPLLMWHFHRTGDIGSCQFVSWPTKATQSKFTLSLDHWLPLQPS